MKDTEAIDSNDQMAAYSEAVKSGLYAKRTGLVGKYDNARRYWEDELTRLFMRPHLTKLMKHCRDQMRRIRIMDLGCGSADGYELLCGVRQRDPSLCDVEVDLLTPETIGLYKGTDLSTDLLEQADEIYGHNPKMVFEQGDFTKGLPLDKDEEPYDLYFSSYGTCSHHNDDETLVNLLAEIAERTQNVSVVVCDWLGRYSYEWQSLWTHDYDELRNLDYVVSYIYDEKEREERRDELEHLCLRLMSRQEAEDIIERASRKAKVSIKPLRFFDRSIMCGRHLDTQEYNSRSQPLRAAINSLHEANTRTNLESVIADYVPKKGFPMLNNWFEHLFLSWNVLVRETEQLFAAYDSERRGFAHPLKPIPATYPEELRDQIVRMRHVVEGIGWLESGLPRENIIEPQLGYALRNLVASLQKGQGCGHGLVAILEIDKR